MKVYVLYSYGEGECAGQKALQCVVVARSSKEAASMLGGDYIEPEEGHGTVSGSANNVSGSAKIDQLHFAGVVRFVPALFWEMDDADRALAGMFGGSGVYERGPLHLLGHGSTVDLQMFEWPVLLPEYLARWLVTKTQPGV